MREIPRNPERSRDQICIYNFVITCKTNSKTSLNARIMISTIIFHTKMTFTFNKTSNPFRRQLNIIYTRFYKIPFLIPTTGFIRGCAVLNCRRPRTFLSPLVVGSASSLLVWDFGRDDGGVMVDTSTPLDRVDCIHARVLLGFFGFVIVSHRQTRHTSLSVLIPVMKLKEVIYLSIIFKQQERATSNKDTRR
jgi:hypothetical protein